MRAYAPTIVLALAGTVVHGYTFAFYNVYTQGVIGGTDTSYSIFSIPPSCGDLDNAVSVRASSDVSGGNGVRCEGSRCQGIGGGTIDELEVRIGDTHWTYYRDRGDDNLVDTNDNRVGSCHIPPGNEVQCQVGPIGKFTGRRILRCDTDGQVPRGLGN